MNDIEAMIESAISGEDNDVKKRFYQLVSAYNGPIDKKHLPLLMFCFVGNVEDQADLVANSYFEVAGHKCQTLDEVERLIKLKAFL